MDTESDGVWGLKDENGMWLGDIDDNEFGDDGAPMPIIAYLTRDQAARCQAHARACWATPYCNLEIVKLGDAPPESTP